MILAKLKLPEFSFNLDTNFIKLIAVFSMFLDHYGKIFSREILAYTIAGRLAFPIFAYCITVGAVHTKSIEKYMLRLAIFAVITQPFYILAFIPFCDNIETFIYNKNILFTLMVGLIGIYGLKEKNWFAVITAVFCGIFIKIDYGVYGILLIFAFYLFRDNKYKSIAVVALLIILQFFLGKKTDLNGIEIGLNGFGLLALPFIYFKTNISIAINKYFFYIFYPAHFILFFVVQIL